MNTSGGGIGMGQCMGSGNMGNIGMGGGGGDMLDNGIDFLAKKAGYEQVRDISISHGFELTFCSEPCYNRKDLRWCSNGVPENNRSVFLFFSFIY